MNEDHQNASQTNENAPLTDEQPSGDQDPIPTPELPPNGVLDFPQMGIRWPVPAMVIEGVLGAVENGKQEGHMIATFSAFNRVAEIHAPRNHDSGDFCIECGRRSLYPCDTLLAVLGKTREQHEAEMAEQEKQMSEQNPETPDQTVPNTPGEVNPDGGVDQPGDAGTPIPADQGDLDGMQVESKEGAVVHEQKSSDQGTDG